MSVSKASEVMAYVQSVVLAFSGLRLNLTNPDNVSLIGNIDEPFSFSNDKLPYTQIYANIARTISKTRDLELKSQDYQIQVFFRPEAIEGIPGSLAISQHKQDAATDMSSIIDDIERNQISDGSIPDCWLENPPQVTVEKSTLYSEPDEQYPPYMVIGSFTLFFDEVHT